MVNKRDIIEDLLGRCGVSEDTFLKDFSSASETATSSRLTAPPYIAFRCRNLWYYVVLETLTNQNEIAVIRSDNPNSCLLITDLCDPDSIPKLENLIRSIVSG